MMDDEGVKSDIINKKSEILNGKQQRQHSKHKLKRC